MFVQRWRARSGKRGTRPWRAGGSGMSPDRRARPGRPAPSARGTSRTRTSKCVVTSVLSRVVSCVVSRVVYCTVVSSGWRGRARRAGWRERESRCRPTRTTCSDPSPPARPTCRAWVSPNYYLQLSQYTPAHYINNPIEWISAAPWTISILENHVMDYDSRF